MHQVARHLALGFERGNERYDDNQLGVGHQLRDFGYLGRQYRLKLTRSKREAVKLKGSYLRVTSPSCTDASHVKKLMAVWYREKAKVRLKERFDAISPRFILLGYTPSPPILRLMTRRWGSYNSIGRVFVEPEFDTRPRRLHRLRDYPRACAHCASKSPKFYELLEVLMPDWLSRKARLEQVLS